MLQAPPTDTFSSQYTVRDVQKPHKTQHASKSATSCFSFSFLFYYLWLIRLHIMNSNFWLHIYFPLYNFCHFVIFLFNKCLYLYFIELPVIQSHPSILDVILNNHVTLPCRATGSPRPTITWQKEGINIFTAGENKSCATVDKISKLFISLQ